MNGWGTFRREVSTSGMSADQLEKSLTTRLDELGERWELKSLQITPQPEKRWITLSSQQFSGRLTYGDREFTLEGKFGFFNAFFLKKYHLEFDHWLSDVFHTSYEL